MYYVSDVCIMFQTYVLCFALMGHHTIMNKDDEILSPEQYLNY